MDLVEGSKLGGAFHFGNGDSVPGALFVVGATNCKLFARLMLTY